MRSLYLERSGEYVTYIKNQRKPNKLYCVHDFHISRESDGFAL